jgi:hypothetical protein
MSTRQIDTKTAIKLAEDQQNIVFAIKAEFDTDDILLHTSIGDLVIDGDTYEGAGQLLSISEIEDSNDLKSAGVTFAITGMDQQVLSYALTENYQNRPITLLMAFISGGTDQVSASMVLYKGRMVQMNISDDPNGASISLQTENRLMDLRRPSNYRYTKESQASLYAGDNSLNEVAKIQDMKINWGRGRNEFIDENGIGIPRR